MSAGWKIATQWRRRAVIGAASRAYVSINKRGEIAMNAEAFRWIRSPANVTLLYDEDSRCIGVKFPVAADRNFFPVRNYGRDGKMRIVRAARLLKQFGIKVERTLTYKNPETQFLDGDPMLVLNLDEGKPIRARPVGKRLRPPARGPHRRL